jgi:CRISPR-associated endonuclease/helicase Cas3
MTFPSFDEFFRTATGHDPYDYQRRLANEGGTDWFGRCESLLINVPTGLGKTAAVVLAWLWNRFKHETNTANGAPEWPRRLVYCLPMRTLVEQTAEAVANWVAKLADTYAPNTSPNENDLAWLAANSPIILMGGEEADPEKEEWDLWPEKPCILIGTQDMLLSRALNRGYGMSRYRWPMHFALLNNDCLWVLDETQLMGVGVETSAQFDGFRCRAEWSRFGNCPTWWMSATLDAERLTTVDHPMPEAGWPTVTLTEDDLHSDAVHARVNSTKPLSVAPFTLTAQTKNGYTKRFSEFIVSQHQKGSFTLVIVNRVPRARELYEALCKAKAAEQIALVHSRFRPNDRAEHEKIFKAKGDRILVATQAVEAGVDISARLLITELAPWSSLVQRFGRCNRNGERDDAAVVLVDVIPKDDKDELVLPYSIQELSTARSQVIGDGALQNVGPDCLKGITVIEKPTIRPVIRRKDLVDLFDTTPDLCGNDLDVSRYIRDGEDRDVQVFWRQLDGKHPEPEEAQPKREELCRAPIDSKFAAFIKKAAAYLWDPLEEKWKERAANSPARPGAVYMLDVKSGGYLDTLGWTGDPKHKPTPLSGIQPPEAYSDDRNTYIGKWVELSVHTQNVIRECTGISEALQLSETIRSPLQTAARWHDIGKAHPEFQSLLLASGTPEAEGKLWAKSKKDKQARSKRKELRHELASALAWLQTHPDDTPDKNLIGYIIAAHHGKVRLSIRSLPGESAPEDKPNAERFARGICEGDEIPIEAFQAIQAELRPSKPLALDLRYMELGQDADRGASWLARTVCLRDRLGPLYLAYVEMLLRAADMRASREEAQAKGRSVAHIRHASLLPRQIL